MGRHLSPRYGQVILINGYPVLTTVNWSQHSCTICVQYQSSCATKLARKCEIEHWFSCGADGRAGGLRAVYGHVITKFSRMGRFTYPWSSAIILRLICLNEHFCQCHPSIKKIALFLLFKNATKFGDDDNISAFAFFSKIYWMIVGFVFYYLHSR